MLPFALVPVLFFLLYILPGAALLSSFGARWRQFETLSLAILLSLIFAPFTLIILSWAAPGSDRFQLIGYICFWAITAAVLRLLQGRTSRWLPEFHSLPRADFSAWLMSGILAAIVVLVRLRIFQGIYSTIGDDPHHLARVTSIATTGLPSFLSRQPLYSFVFYDLDFVAPALLARYTGGEIGISLAWVIHAGVHAFAISIFLTRLLYMYAATWKARIFGLFSLHLATGFDLFFLPWMGETPHLDNWPRAIGLFTHPFFLIAMPISTYLWVPQHLLGLAVAGLICFITLSEPFSNGQPPKFGSSAFWNEGLLRAIAVAVLLAALLRTSTFVFLGVLPGLTLWHLREFLVSRERKRDFCNHSVTAIVTLILSISFLVDISQKPVSVDLGLRYFAFLGDSGLAWLSPVLAVPVALVLEIGILIPLLFYLLKQSHLHSRKVQFWLCMSAGLLLPFVTVSPWDIGMRGILPAFLATTILATFVINLWDSQKRNFLTALVALQVLLSTVTAGSEVYFRYAQDAQAIPSTTRWIAENTPLNSLVFYEQDSEKDDFREVNYGERMSYIRSPRHADVEYTTVPFKGWSCLPEVNLYEAHSLCSIERLIPDTQSVFVRYNSPEPRLPPAFVLAYRSDSKSVYSLSCQDVEEPQFSSPPTLYTHPFQQFHTLLAEVPKGHSVAASTNRLALWLQSETDLERLFEVSPGRRNSPISPQQHISQQLALIEEGVRPIWFLLDGYSDLDSNIELHVWNEMLYTHLMQNYFVTQPVAGGSEWLPCLQRLVLALPSSDVALEVVLSDLTFDEAVTISKLSMAPGPHSPGDVVPIQLDYRRTNNARLKFFVHFLDETGTLHAQIDPFATDDGTGQPQLTRVGLYLPLNLPIGEYQLRIGLYRADDGRRLARPSGQDNILIPLTLTR